MYLNYLCKKKPFEKHFSNNTASVRCDVLNQTTVVPNYYVHMFSAGVTFLFTPAVS